jgi:hypothetical protein
MTWLEALGINIVWAGAVQWLLNNPTHPAWWDTTRLVQAMGGLPDPC